MIKSKKILIGVTGSVAACKVPDLVSALEKEGAKVSLLMTDNARDFLKKDKFAHINLGKDYDLILIAPCTANTLAKISNGICDNLLTQAVLASTCPVMIAPAMNFRMLKNSITQDNLQKLRDSSYVVLPTEKGRLACGEGGCGRMLEVSDILDRVKGFFADRDFEGKTLLLTGGATREMIDPVRFISNRSSGKMALALANAACARGARVIFVKGVTLDLDVFEDVKVLEVENASEMLIAAKAYLKEADFFVSVAAVCDFKSAKVLKQKIKKSDEFDLKLVKNIDVLRELPRLSGKKYVGFALETSDFEKNAQKKLLDKDLDLIVLNTPESLESDEISASIVDRDQIKKLKKMKKTVFADVLLDVLL